MATLPRFSFLQSISTVAPISLSASTVANPIPEFAPVTGEATYTAQFNAFYLDADYTAVNAAVDQAMTYQDSDKYTSVSYNRLFAAVAAVDYTLTIDKQAQVDAYAAAILDAISKLVSTTDYDAAYTKCAEVNNDGGQYTVDSYNAFKAAFEAIGAKKDFNTEEATQAQVDEAKAALDAAGADNCTVATCQILSGGEQSSMERIPHFNFKNNR